jgi:hypothetical protein
MKKRIMSEAMERKRENKNNEKEKESIKRLVGGTPKNNSVKEHRILANVYPKRLRSPSASSLDGSEVSSGLGKRGSTSRPQ